MFTRCISVTSDTPLYVAAGRTFAALLTISHLKTDAFLELDTVVSLAGVCVRLQFGMTRVVS